MNRSTENRNTDSRRTDSRITGTGITDLDRMLAELTVSRRQGSWTMISTHQPVSLADGVGAIISEAEGTTAVVTVQEADQRGWDYEFEAAWLTLEIHSSLEGVGLTAAVSEALAVKAIPCNVLAGYFHDHLLVPIDRADEAMAAIQSLADHRS